MATANIIFSLLGIVFLSCSMIGASRDFETGRNLLQYSEADIDAGAEPGPGEGEGAPIDNNLVAQASASAVVDAGGVKVFDVTLFGAVADGKNDSVVAFRAAWGEACKNSTNPAKVLIPKGIFLAGPTLFSGPCTSPKPITVEIQGTIKAITDLSEYVSPQWFTFEDIDGLVVQGNGVFDGQGPVNWKFNDCKQTQNCAPLPANLRFDKVINSNVKEITSLDSMYFHYHVHRCNNLTFTGITMTAPGNSPNTDGMHISMSDKVSLLSSMIGTGDDCVSIGHSSTNITIRDVTCGPGHGISVGSLGKRPEEESVDGVSVTNCTFIRTTNGARIKTWIGTKPGEAKNIVFEDLIMEDVQNPIIIDQSYGGKKQRAPSNSLWKISDVHFRKIKGTTVSNVAVSLQCSSMNPCDGVEIADVDLILHGPVGITALVSSCVNAKAIFGGKLNPPACAIL
ncbi:PREDICTED: exopolygalacturonase clone GBGE184-like [Lupinus angustifolius]|nr:PREDICTED: exopolygalacturonase clone GBGE184-like [Lupinus angustifolius]